MTIAIAATMNARTGATAAGIRTFSMMPAPLMASAPSATNAAPMRPPISPCEELDGRPRLHDAMSHAIAPTSTARTAVVEQRGDRVAARAVPVVLEAVDLDREVRQVLEGAQPRHRAFDLTRRLQQDVRHPLRLLHRRLDLVEAEVVGDLVDEVDDVVE